MSLLSQPLSSQGQEPGNATASTTVDPRRARIILVLLIAAAIGSSTSIAGVRQLLVSDVILVGTLTWVGFFDRYRPARVLGRTASVFGVAAMGFVASTYIANLGTSFIPTEAVLTFAKLAVYVVSIVLFADVLPTLAPTTVVRYLRRTLQLLLIVSLAQQVSHRIGINVWPLETYAAGPWDRSSFPRSASLFSEPAYLSIFTVIATFRLWIEQQLKRSDLVVAAVLLALGASLAGAGLAMAAILLGSNRRSLAVGVVRLAPWLALLAIVVAIVPTTRDIVERRVIERIGETASGTDASGSARLADSWAAAFEVVDGRFLTGVGIGQLGPELIELFDGAAAIELDSRLNDAGGTWNVIANVYAETGVLGLAALAISLRKYGVDRQSGVLMIVVCFATGTFAGWLWWAALAMLAIPPCGPYPKVDSPLQARLTEE